jgi:hypothetical protein
MYLRARNQNRNTVLKEKLEIHTCRAWRHTPPETTREQHESSSGRKRDAAHLASSVQNVELAQSTVDHGCSLVSVLNGGLVFFNKLFLDELYSVTRFANAARTNNNLREQMTLMISHTIQIG